MREKILAHVAPGTPPTVEDIERAALIAARLAGCDCDPTITVRYDDGVFHTYLAHDIWCGHRSQRKGRDA